MSLGIVIFEVRSSMLILAHSPFIPNLDEPTAADNQNEPYLNYYQYLLSQPNSALPNVITNSYGDDEQVKKLLLVCHKSLLVNQHDCADCPRKIRQASLPDDRPTRVKGNLCSRICR